jgi:predicted dienelactone hydrolase
MLDRAKSVVGVFFLALAISACQAGPTLDELAVAAGAEGSAAPSVPGVDAPELARLGPFSVGTSLETFVLPARVSLTISGVADGHLTTAARSLPVRVWYPARAARGAAPVSYPHTLRRPGVADIELLTPGIAFADAAPVDGMRFPLIVVSHGYGGWSASMSYLTENLASKGYVVVAIDHLDRPLNAGTDAQLDFGNVLMDRARDQREIIAALIRKAETGEGGFARLIDPGKIGLIGYSMGGYGALGTAGAAYDPGSPTLKLLPEEGRTALLSDGGPDVSADIKALVAIAPWGGQPPSRMWTPDALKRIGAPVLLIDGDQDDVVDFGQGVRWIFDELSSDRRLLVFEGARHNVGNNPAPPGFDGPFSTWEFFAEPVWRTDRMNAINLHFITAFLDLELKGDARKAGYLNVPTQKASEGVWKASPGQQVGGAPAGDAQPGYWRGFQARWAVGLELHHRGPHVTTPGALALPATPG